MGVRQHMFIDLPANKINYDAMFAQQAKAKRGARALRAPRGPSGAEIATHLNSRLHRCGANTTKTRGKMSDQKLVNNDHIKKLLKSPFTTHLS